MNERNSAGVWELAPTLTAYIMAISVFGDISQLLTAPIAATIAKRKNLSMSVVTPYVITAVWFTHGVVPPSAAILAAAGSMAAASMAAAGICLPIMSTLGLSPVAVTLAIGLGTVLFGHVNDSGCWMCRHGDSDGMQCSGTGIRDRQNINRADKKYRKPCGGRIC